MTPYTANLPTPAAPMVDPATGIVSPAWWAWFSSIFSRTGSAPGVGVTVVQTTANGAQTTATAANATATSAHAVATAASAAVAAEAATRAAADAVLTAELTPGQLAGTATNDAAIAGKVGEYVSAGVIRASALGLTSTVAANVASMTLSGGDWDVTGQMQFTGPVNTSINYLVCAVTSIPASTASGGVADQPCFGLTPFLYSDPVSLTSGPTRFSLAVATTIYLVAASSFAAATNSAYGVLRARRVR